MITVWGAIARRASSCSCASEEMMLEYPMTASGWNDWRAAIVSSSGVRTESWGAVSPLRRKAAKSCFERWIGLGAPMAASRVDGPMRLRAKKGKWAAIQVVNSGSVWTMMPRNPLEPELAKTR